MGKIKREWGIIRNGSNGVWKYCESEAEALFESALMNADSRVRRNEKDNPFHVVQVSTEKKEGK